MHADAHSKYYESLLAALNTFPDVREAVLRWATETGTKPSDREMWEVISAAYIGTFAGLKAGNHDASEGLRKSANRLELSTEAIESYLERAGAPGHLWSFGFFPGDFWAVISAVAGFVFGALVMYWFCITFFRCAP